VLHFNAWLHQVQFRLLKDLRRRLPKPHTDRQIQLSPTYAFPNAVIAVQHFGPDLLPNFQP
jgi:hypothetical protein